MMTSGKKQIKRLSQQRHQALFSFEERKTYFKKKWRKEHISLFVMIGLILIAALIIPLVINKPWLISLSPILAVVGHCYQHNKMMIYVENNLYH